jgi:hypothetical protein
MPYFGIKDASQIPKTPALRKFERFYFVIRVPFKGK